ncbi:methyltransferase domain-containing protein [bacterium]|nr:methyltransferase domain-containing protein [bacterium]
MQNTIGFYSFSELYFRVRTPEETEVDDVVSLIQRYSERPVRRLLDPTCGPGNWLFPLSRRGFEVVGVDNSREMVNFARSILPESEILLADSFDPAYQWPRVDGVLELAGVLSIFLEEEGLRNFLRQASNCLPPGGFAAFTVFRLPPAETPAPFEWSSDRHMADGMHVAAAYQSLEVDRVRKEERIRRMIVTGDDAERQIISDETYRLKLYDEEELARLIAIADQFELCTLFDPETRGTMELNGPSPAHSFIVVLRKKTG